MGRFFGSKKHEDNLFNTDIFGQRLKKPRKKFVLNIILFLLTFMTCMAAGAAWAMKDPFDISNWHYGLTYAILILTFLSAHEFGHYFASVYHKVDATLPYYIPAILPDVLFGTFGAVIKTRSPIPSRKALFDIGVAGPISGFIVCLIFLIYGLLNLPGKESIYQFHPNYSGLVANYSDKGLYFGDTILYHLLTGIFS